MRKLVWCGAACAVAAAVAVYLAADYAAKHPDSYLGRCATAAAYLGARSNPFTLAGTVVGQEGVNAAARAGAGAVCGVLGCNGAQDEMAEIHKPAEACEPEERVEMREPEEAAEPVEPIRPEILPQDPFPCDSEDDHEGLANGELVPFTVPVMPMQTEEPMPDAEHPEPCEPCERAPACVSPDEEMPERIAPPADQEDDTEEAAEGPEPIPAPAEECCEEHGCPCGYGCWLYRLIKETGVFSACAAEEAAEAIETPADEVEMLPMPTDCDGEATPVDEVEMLPMPTDCDDEPQEGGIEESKPPMSECPQTDYHHYHHNSCPYMGCPYPYYRSAPVVHPVEKPAKIRKKKRPSMAKPGSAEWLWKMLFGFDMERPRQTGIETLEFRPTDDIHTTDWNAIPY
jgi:hypothetical protein